MGLTLTIDGDKPLRQSDGVIIDFGGRQVQWTDADLKQHKDPFELLEFACDKNSFTCTIEDGKVIEVNGVQDDSEFSWDFWVVTRDVWIRYTGSQILSECKVCAWAYCSEADVPSIAVDASGNSIYGYKQANAVVSLSPSITEIIGALNAVTTLVGVDQFSNYPHSVIEGKETGSISVIGGYVNPSFELIMHTNPDVVFCDGSQYYHIDMQRKLISNGCSAVLLFDGEDIDTILNNIFIVGTVMGYGMRANDVINDIDYSINKIVEDIFKNPLSKNPDVLVSLSGDKSPWASGNYTYVSDAVQETGGNNTLSFLDGWVHISPEIIADVNPQVAILLMSSYEGAVTDYDTVLKNMSEEWKSTDAYKNGRIFILTDGAADFAQRSSPRVGQLTELIARMMQPDIFTDLELPKSIGDDYVDYLTYTSGQSYDN